MATILIIDDTATNRDFLVTLLGYYQHRLLEAEDGTSGLELARKEHPSLIIADILMPTMDGYEFVRQLRLDDQVGRTPVIFYTAHYLEKEALDLAASCAVGHVITKPSDPKEVLRVIELALGVNAPLKATQTPVEFDREHLRLMTDKLAEKAATLRTTNLRLDALIQLGQQLATEQDPCHLVERYCSGIRDIIGAAFAGIGLSGTDDHAGCGSYFSGSNSVPGKQMISLWQDHAVVREAMATREVRRLTNPRGDPTLLGVSGEYPAIFSFLAVPVWSGTQTHGWLGLWNKLGGEPFTEEDANLASTVCAQLAVRYENTRLYEQVRASNVNLEGRVTERTRELASANAELFRSNAELEQYAFLASHDLQEPLRMMAIYSQKLLKHYRGKLDPDGELSLDYIQSGAKRMRQLIDDLSDYSKLVVDTTPRELELVDLNKIVQAAKANCEASLKDNCGSFFCEPLPNIRGYSDQLLQVFQNLISNAIRYRRAEAPPVIRIWGKVTGVEVLIGVEDNGLGLKMEFAEAIFRLFLRLHGREMPGTGIGLSICKRAVENHGGRIWVESVVGHGSTFYLNLPKAHPVLATVAS